MTIDDATRLTQAVALPAGWSLTVRLMRTFEYGNHEWGLEVRHDGEFVTGNRGIYDRILESEIRTWAEVIWRKAEVAV